MTEDAAARAIAAWEVEAASRGLTPDAADYWDAGEAWIVAMRRRPT